MKTTKFFWFLIGILAVGMAGCKDADAPTGDSSMDGIFKGVKQPATDDEPISRGKRPDAK